MDKSYITQLEAGFTTAFIDSSVTSNLAYKPQFISNNYREGNKVISSIEDELCSCDQFFISVAFITSSGVTPLLQILKELEQKHIPGKILTTDYLAFSEPDALDKLANLKNIELKMYQSNASKTGFHTKGYIFQKDEIYKIIVGSSNLTLSALTTNREWNSKLVSTGEGEYAQNILNEFNELWNSSYSLSYDKFIDEYRTLYKQIALQKELARKNKVTSIAQYKLKPNKMQIEFINSFRELLSQNEKRGLLISATGTGKTYASAFAMRELGFKRVLFLVHRTQIAKQAMDSFKQVFDSKIKMGMLTGKYQDYDADFIFATVQTLSKDENITKFPSDYFDCCIYDEAHHTAAGSYKKVMDYFTPQFALGMTATPDKRDDNMEGRNIYEIFDHNIACEIRLKQAMEEDLLCPFHYFGITDMEMIADNDKIQDSQVENFRYLTSDERVEHVMTQADYYGYSGDRVKGLIFCSRIDEANKLSEKFNIRGLKTIVLSGADPESVREDAINRLVMDIKDEEFDNHLDYILSVDIFSEAVDVPAINQVIMLRPTQSPIVFVQQLGRGLRKYEGKEYVVVLDFIGNYKNNFMIPIALSGDRSYNKDNIRRYIMEGCRVIPGASTIHFDEISRKRIFAAVDNANFSDIKLIKENYINLKNKLGRIPALKDFDDYGEMDVLRIFDNNSLGSYYKFLVKYEREYKVRLSGDEEKVIEFVSKKLANGKRIHELELLNRMLTYSKGLLGLLKTDLKEHYNMEINSADVDNIVNIMTNEFPAGASKKTYEKCVFLESDKANVDRINGNSDDNFTDNNYVPNDYRITKNFSDMLSHKEFYNMLKELIEFGISRYKRDYANTYEDTSFVLYQKYTYEDACRLLGWEHNEVPLNIGGYKYDKKTQTFPVFINYEKSDNISDTTKYEDHFINSSRLIAISKSGRSCQSEDVQNFLHAKERGIDVQLFVRKNKDDKISKEFYYLGRMTASGRTEEFTMANTDKTAVEIEWILNTPVRKDIYDYIVNG